MHSSKNALGCRYSTGYTGRTYRKPPVGLRGKVTEESGEGGGCERGTV